MSPSSAAATSVSVSDSNVTPLCSSSSLSSAKFSMMPLWMTASFPPSARCGWAFWSVGPPCVAHRVCPIPVNDAGNGSASSAAVRLASFPDFFRDDIDPSATTAMPAESYPRYSRRRRPSRTTSKALCPAFTRPLAWPTYPTIPHMDHSLAVAGAEDEGATLLWQSATPAGQAVGRDAPDADRLPISQLAPVTAES